MDVKNINSGDINSGGGDVRIGDNFYQTIILNSINTLNKYKNLISNTKRVLDKIGDNINGVKLERKLSQKPLDDLFNTNQFISINGVAGSGKSFYAKQIIEELTDTCIICFPADQFLKNSLVTALHEYNIENGINDVFGEFSEYPKKLIYIDSFEKLLEGEGDAFNELIIFLRENREIKLLLSCRDYAFDTLKFKFFSELDIQEIKVPLLNETEFEFFKNKIPVLQKISSNENLKAILKVPKYLSLAVKLLSKSNVDYSSINVIDFKKALWNFIIEGTNQKDAIHSERQKTFINLTLKRAKNLTLVTSVNEFNSIAIKELFNEGVLFQEDDLYAPSHDIFEDWGLIKYLDGYYAENNEVVSFYKGLGNEPAIRRGFRLWIESKIEEKQNWIYTFIIDTINKPNIESNWKDEVITAITKSEYCEQYFAENEINLKENEYSLLKRFIHLLKISGKNSKQVPNNGGWNTVIIFIHNNLSSLLKYNRIILEFLLEWQNVLFYTKIEDKSIPKLVGEIIYEIIIHHKEHETSSYNNDNSIDTKCIKLLYQLTEYIPENIKSILNEISKPNAVKLDFRKGNYVKEKIDYALSHFYSGKLVSVFPDEVVEIANQNWKEQRNEEDDSFFYRGSNEIEHSFGLASKHSQSYYPESAYQTFVFKFLNSHPHKALDFIIDFTNFATNNYLESSFLKDDRAFMRKDEIEKIQLLYDEKVYSIFGSNYLWSINRGGQIVVPDLLQSIVIALERYLFETGKINFEGTEEIINSHIQLFFNEIYTKSNSVILISVLSSIAMAFPNRIGNKFLPLLSSKYFFEWDRNRWIQDTYRGDRLLGWHQSSVVSKLADEERIEALNWEHRTKYYKGLEGFVVDYQFNIREFNKEVHQYLDLLKGQINDNISDKKLIAEIDARNWNDVKKVKAEDGNTIIQIQPDYSHDIELSKQMEENADVAVKKNKNSTYHLWITNTFQKKSTENLTYEYWKETLQYIQKNSQSDEIMDFINPFPIGTLAVIGIENFKNQMKSKEFKWCINTILDIAISLYKRKDKRFDFENMDFSISIYDNDSVYGILPILYKFENELTQKQYGQIKVLIFLYLRDLDSSTDTDIKHLYLTFKNQFWNINYDYAFACFIGIINYARFNRKYPKHVRLTKKELSVLKKEESQILAQIEQTNLSFNFNEINYKEFSHWDLKKTIEIFPTRIIFDFSYQFLDCILSEQLNSFSYEKDSYRSNDYYDIGVNIKNVLAEFLLENDVTENSKQLFKKIIEFEKTESKNYKYNRDIDKYLFDCVQEFYCYVDSNQNEKVLKNFWVYWNILFDNLKNRKDLYFNKEFLFYLGFWKHEANDCYMLTINSNQFIQQINDLPNLHIEALLQLSSGIGFEKLVPQLIVPIVKHLKNYAPNIDGNCYYYAEKLIMRCFNSKMKEIKSNKSILLDFLYLLEKLIEIGSSKAYYIRENIILYKNRIEAIENPL